MYVQHLIIDPWLIYSIIKHREESLIVIDMQGVKWHKHAEKRKR